MDLPPEDGLIRLNKLLATLGVESRRHAEEMIIAGRITVDGVTATEKGQKVRRGAVIKVDGVEVGPPPPPAWLALHKPKGYVSTKEDTRDRPIVMDLLPPELSHVHSIGRLDGDVSGLLLFTNQGELTHRLAHPSYGVEKVYHAATRRRFSEDAARRLAHGVDLNDGPTAPAKCRVVGREGSGSLVELIIHEGRKHQVKRMFEAVGYPLAELRRVAVGPVSLGDLERGRWRHLTDAEVDELYRMAGLPRPSRE